MLDMSTEGWISNEIKVINSGISQNSSDDVIFLMEGKVNKLERVLEEIKLRKEFTGTDIAIIQQEVNEHRKQLNSVLKWRATKEAVMMIFKKIVGQIKVDEDTRSSKVEIELEPVSETTGSIETEVESDDGVKNKKSKKKE